MLTNARIREAKPRATRFEISCDALPGFILRVLPTGKKVFFARVRDAGGKDRRHRLGQLGPGFGIDEARRAAMVLLADAPPTARTVEPDPPSVPRPHLPAPAPPTRPTAPTLREFACRFEHEHIDMHLKPETASHYRRSLRLHVLPALGDRALDSITTADVQRLHNTLKSKPSAGNYARAVLSSLFSKAERWGVLTTRNPVTFVDRFAERAVERFLTPDERARLEQALDIAAKLPACRPGAVGQEGIWAIRLLALTGMRRDEVRNLRWEQVDWRQAVLHLPDSKTGKRDIIVSDDVMALLTEISKAKRYPRQGLVVCSRTGKKLHSLGPSWDRIRKAAHIPDVRLHDLRHSVASDAIMDGVPLEVVGKMLGHRNYQTTQRYAHIADSALREAVNRTSKTIVRASQSSKPRPSRRSQPTKRP